MPGLGAAKRECGETKGRNDLAALCNHLLLAQGIEETLWSAFVSIFTQFLTYILPLSSYHYSNVEAKQLPETKYYQCGLVGCFEGGI
jgi:hypothetical protein